VKQAFDHTEVRLLLRRMVEKGLVTVEQLDTPSLGYQQLVLEMSRHKVVELRSFPIPPYRNPLRDVPSEPAVEITSPRDFAPAHPSPGILPGHPPLPLSGQLDQSLDHHRGQRQDPSPDEADHEYPF